MAKDLTDVGRFGTELPAPTGRTVVRRELVKTGLFLRGPISWNWLCAAARHRGRALDVGLAIMMEAGLSGSAARRGHEPIKLRSAFVRGLGVDRYAERRALLWLEAEGLITVDRHRGRRPRITLVEAVTAEHGEG